MGLFRKSKADESSGSNRLIAGHLIGGLSRVGQATFGPNPTYIDVSEYYLPATLEAGMPTQEPGWGTFVDLFANELLEASIQFGGWVSAGALHVAKDFVKSEDWAKPALIELMDRGLLPLIAAGVDSSHIPIFAQPRWAELRQLDD